MICAHCKESFSAWRELSSIFRARYKCPACGKFSYVEFVGRRDRADTFLVLGFAAAFVVLLFVAAQSENMVFLKNVPGLALIGFVAFVAITMYRMRHRYHLAVSLPPHELRQRRWFIGGSILHFVSLLLYLLTRWLEWWEGFGFAVFMCGVAMFFVISFVTSAVPAKRDTV